MGTLRSTQWTSDDPPVPVCKGFSYNGVILGEPVELDGNPATAEWDDGAFPNGSCEVVDGVLVVTPDDDPMG